MLLSVPENSAGTAKLPNSSLPEAMRQSGRPLAILRITSRGLPSGGALRRRCYSRGIFKIYVFYRFIRRGTRRFLRSAITGIDLDHFPGSCCG
jgi:hypothetical protein